MNTEILFFVLVFVFVFHELLKSYPKLSNLILLLPVLVVIDNLIIPGEVKRFNKNESHERVNSIYKAIQSQVTDYKIPVAFMPVSKPGMDYETNLDIMLACQDLLIPCVNGYSGWVPPSYEEFYNKANDAGLKTWLDFNNMDEKSVQKVHDIGEGVVDTKTIKLIASNNKYVATDHSKDHILIADRDEGYQWETFILLVLENNRCALLSDERLFVSARFDNHKELTATSKHRMTWETYEIVWLENSYIALKADNGKFVTFDAATNQLFAWADNIGENEKFLIKEE